MKKKKRLSPPNHLAAISVLSRAVTTAMTAPIGGQRPPRKPVSAIAVIALAEAEGRPLGIKELQAAFHDSQATTSRAVATLVRMGAVETYSLPSDGRRTGLRLTKEGRRFVDTVLAAMIDEAMKHRRRQARKP